MPARPAELCSQRLDDTVVLVTVVARQDAKAGQDFFPLDLRVPREDVRCGQIPRRLLQARGPALREGDAHLAVDRSSDPAALPEGFTTKPGHRDRHVVGPENDADVLALIGASAALLLSDIPFNGPIVGVARGPVDGQ